MSSGLTVTNNGDVIRFLFFLPVVTIGQWVTFSLIQVLIIYVVYFLRCGLKSVFILCLYLTLSVLNWHFFSHVNVSFFIRFFLLQLPGNRPLVTSLEAASLIYADLRKIIKCTIKISYRLFLPVFQELVGRWLQLPSLRWLLWNRTAEKPL